MQYSVKSQAVAFQKLAEEPRLRRAILAGTAISLSVAYAQVPADHLLARQFTPGWNFKPTEFAPLPGFRQTAGASLIAAAPVEGVKSKPVFGARDTSPADQGSVALVPALSHASRDRPDGLMPTAKVAPKPTDIIPPETTTAIGGDVALRSAQLEASVVAASSGVVSAAGASAGAGDSLEQSALVQTPVSVTSPGSGQNSLGASASLAVNVNAQPSEPAPAPPSTSQALSAVRPGPVAAVKPSAASVDLPAVAAGAPENLVTPSISTASPPPAAATGNGGAASLAAVLNSADHFDLGALKVPTRVGKAKAPALAASSTSRNLAARSGAARTRLAVGRVHDRIEGDAVFHLTQVSIDDMPAGKLSVRIGMSGDLSLRLGDLLSLYEKDMAPAVFARLSGSSATQEFVSFETLRNAGIAIRYEAGRDRLAISARD